MSEKENATDDPTPEKESASPKPFWRRTCRFVSRVCLVVIGVYFAIVLVGLIPVNNDFQETPGGIRIYVVSNAVHADLVLPLEAEGVDWGDCFPAESFRGNIDRATHVAIGWGDRGFFLKTPTWADLEFSVVANALLFPSDTCMHVDMTRAEFLGSGARSVEISAPQYQQLVDSIRASMDLNADGSAVLIANASYGASDAFFDAKGRYHCLNTCNSWVGRVLKSAGVKTPWIAPLPKTVYLYFPDEIGND